MSALNFAALLDGASGKAKKATANDTGLIRFELPEGASTQAYELHNLSDSVDVFARGGSSSITARSWGEDSLENDEADTYIRRGSYKLVFVEKTDTHIAITTHTGAGTAECVLVPVIAIRVRRVG